ncbi:protein NETWORKED 3A-like [Trifolium pratense]|uniref:protein NETWORKED 3A-like n=1 Tax=Trifolium pratense TaxID=57577 RepID=UPI001E692AFF|nr:protein NETWORKED 3A-like [Trifolium pratense]
MNNHPLMLMENKDDESWSSSAPIYQSQWLQTTISDLDEKLGAMMSILEVGNSPNQEDMHCKRRDDLIQMLKEFGQSYRVLAIAYNQLKSKTSHGTFHSRSLSSAATSKIICASCNRRTTGNLEDKKLENGCNSHRKFFTECSHVKSGGTNLDFEILKMQEDESDVLSSSSPCSMKLQSEVECIDIQLDRMTDVFTDENILMKIEDLELNQRTEDPSIINSKFESMWPTLKYQMTKLTEDNLHQLEELAQRNDEKRETIRRLQLEVETLKRKNNALQISSRYSNADSECRESQISTPGTKSVGMFFKGCSPRYSDFTS